MIAVDKKYIGIPFDVMNCWQFICHYFRTEFTIELPDFNDEYTDADDKEKIVRLYERETANRIWPPTDHPQHPDIVVFKINGYLWHAGIVLGDRRMLHTQRGCNSVIEKYNSHRWRNRLHGFYRHQPDEG